MQNRIQVTSGKKGDSGYDTLGNVNKDEYNNGTSRWIHIGGTKLRGVPDQLYFASHGDFIIVAYNTKDSTIRAFWNVTKNEGKRVGILHLIFHPYFWIVAILGSCFLLGFKNELKNEVNFRYYSFLAYGITLFITFIYSVIDWRKDKAASEMVQQVKDKL